MEITPHCDGGDGIHHDPRCGVDDDMVRVDLPDPVHELVVTHRVVQETQAQHDTTSKSWVAKVLKMSPAMKLRAIGSVSVVGERLNRVLDQFRPGFDTDHGLGS